MKDRIARRSFLKIAGMSLGIGVIYEFAPLLASRLEAGALTDYFKKVNGEAPASFTLPSSATRTSAFMDHQTRFAPKLLKPASNKST